MTTARCAPLAVLCLLSACVGVPRPTPDDTAACTRYVAYTTSPPAADVRALEGALEAAGAVPVTLLPEIGAVVVCAPSGALGGMRAAGARLVPDGRVTIPPGESVQPVGPAALAVVRQWHLDKVHAAEAWAVSQGEDVVIVVVDTGADGSHAGLRNRIIGGANYTGGRACGSNLNCDGHGHGTHVAATAAETLDSGLPPDVDGGTGLAPRAGLFIAKALDDGGSGWASAVARAILDAGNSATAGQRTIISMSLGSSQPDESIRDAIGYATRAGALVVAARGNAGGRSPSWPACFEPVVGVAATRADDRRAPFSDYGDCTDIAAPGVDIVAAAPGGGYASMSGTSMSTPMVSGALALLVALGDRDPMVTIMTTSAGVVDATIPGRLDVAAAVRGVRPGPTVTAGPTAPGRVVTEEATREPYPGEGTPAPTISRPTATRTPRPTATRALPGSCEAAGLIEKRSAIIGRFCAPR